VITTYGVLAAEHVDGERSPGPLLTARWLRVVLDEGHHIKGFNTKAHKAAMQLQADRRWVVTGTPIQNNLMELWSLTTFLQFSVYSEKAGKADFKRLIEQPCLRGDNDKGFERLKVLMDTIALRRSKTDRKADGSLIVPLPTKTVLIRQVELAEEERFCYAIFRQEARAIVARFDRQGALLRNYAHVFALMMRMRQLCCHRELIKVFDWTEILRDREAVATEMGVVLRAEAGVGAEAAPPPGSEEERRLVAQLRTMIKDGVTDDCSVCLDDLKSPVITPCAHVFCRRCIETVLETVKPPSCPLCRRAPMLKAELLEAGHQEDGEGEDTTLADMEDIKVEVSSGKVNACIKEILRIKRDKPDDKIVVVSQFTSFLSIVQPLLAENEVSYTRLDGTMAIDERADVIKVFQAKTRGSPKVLLLSLKAGGVGLNLTSANHLLLLDPAWNPASEWQCFDRIHRMGQTKPVTIYKFITKESIEEKMVDIQDAKKDLINGAFAVGTDARRRQRIADIRNIFDL